MKAHDDIVDNLREQLLFLDKHPDFNESCTTLYIFEAITEIKKLRKQLHDSDKNINECLDNYA